MPFNDEQTAAIEAPMNEDILISAGAGSGKTKTLSRRVFNLLTSGQIEPSELLILTFTDNAAHEMKSRIIKDLKGAYPRVNEMYSAHIQTFDSFSSYLVKKYAPRLGLSDRIVVADASVIEAKRNQFLDEILNEYYADPIQRERVIQILNKHEMKDDSWLKTNVLLLDMELGKFIPSKKKEFLSNYEQKFLSREFFDTCVASFVEKAKKQIVQTIYECYLRLSCPNFTEVENIDSHLLEDPRNYLQRLDAFFQMETNFQWDVRKLDFSENKAAENLYKKGLLPLLDESPKDFLKDVHELLKNEELLSSENKDDIFKEMKFLFVSSNKQNLPYLSDVLSVHDDLDEEWKFFLSLAPDTKLLIEIVNKLDERLWKYKKENNFFTFSDVSTLALSLLTDKNYSDIAEEVRQRFKYIMVDEYQDTNDLQEAFLDSLMKMNQKGERSHLFCVGDAKQSIYAFRNSNVALFRARQEKYKNKNAEHEVIAMNKNYRSGAGLLHDINYIFDNYMTLDHGSITYKDKMEQLQYDKEVNLYSEPYDNFGVYRIVSKSENKDDWTAEKGPKNAYYKLWEATAIIEDIQKKVKEGYKVYDREGKEKVRPCKYQDFAILMRKKSGFALYQKLFNQAGIPLNNVISSDLKDVDAIILLQSLVKMIALLFHKSNDVNEIKHLFVSIARSYAYSYTDEKLYELISYKDKEKQDDLLFIKKDPLWQDLSDFVERNKDKSFNDIFLDLLNTFHVIDKLYLIGNVDDVISKIESIHQLILASEQAGEGLDDFVLLLNNINKYDLDLDSSSIFQAQDAVDMMTIHASKGLERKIVYMPCSFNEMSAGSNLSKPDYLFSEDYGILLPNADLPLDKKEETIYSIPYLVAKNTPSSNGTDRDEHVRLFYVALTRAENTIFIVGDDYKGEEADKNYETLYGMLDYCPHYYKLNEGYLKELLSKHAIKEEQYNLYHELLDATKKIHMPLDPSLLKDRGDLYQYLTQKYYLDGIRNALERAIDSIKQTIFDYYLSSFKTQAQDLNVLASLYDAYHTNIGVKSFEEYLSFFENNKNDETSLEEDEDDTDSSDNDEEENDYQKPQKEDETMYQHYTRDELVDLLKEFGEALSKQNSKYFKTLKTKKGIALTFAPIFAKVFGNVDSFSSLSYQTDEFLDRIERKELVVSDKDKDVSLPPLDKPEGRRLNDEEIVFALREKQRASKNSSLVLEDEELKENLARGTYLHRLLEFFDFSHPDLSYIKEPKDKALIEKLIQLPLMQEALSSDELYQEYGYFDRFYQTTGFIDLLFIKNGHIYIVDYKTSDIDDPEYANQLHTYQRNIQEIFHVKPTDISLYLLSILRCQVKEVPTEKEL